MKNDLLTREELAGSLEDLPVGEIHCFDRVGSTNDFGFERAAAGAPDLSVITAFEQVSGRGRMHRKWVTVAGTSLPLTVIIRPSEQELRCLNLFSPLTGLAVREALSAGWKIGAEIKWPNDVLLNRRKICGVLCETQWEGDHLNALILGLGTNLLHGAAPEIPDLTYPASSVEDETGIVIGRAAYIRAFIEQLIRLRPLIGKPVFFELWESCLAYKNEKAVVVRPDGEAVHCVVNGIDAEGNLCVTEAGGRTASYMAGEISLRPA